jgi:hypothetical protein
MIFVWLPMLPLISLLSVFVGVWIFHDTARPCLLVRVCATVGIAAIDGIRYVGRWYFNRRAKRLAYPHR